MLLRGQVCGSLVGLQAAAEKGDSQPCWLLLQLLELERNAHMGTPRLVPGTLHVPLSFLLQNPLPLLFALEAWGMSAMFQIQIAT